MLGSGEGARDSQLIHRVLGAGMAGGGGGGTHKEVILRRCLGDEDLQQIHRGSQDREIRSKSRGHPRWGGGKGGAGGSQL